MHLIEQIKYLLEHIRKEWPSILFPASLAVILHHMGYLAILTKLSLLIVSNQATNSVTIHPSVDGNGPVALLITEQDYQDRYKERSPLDRCILSEDISKILKRGVKSLVIDLDLSPMLGQNSDEASCQKRLDAVIDGAADQLVLLLPFTVESLALRDVKHIWMGQRCSAGIAFGDGDLEKSLGIVIDSQKNNNGMADLTKDRKVGSVCDDIAQAGDSAGRNWRLKKAENGAHSTPKNDAHGQSEPINFKQFSEEAVIAGIDDSRLDQISNWKSRVAFFGGAYGTDDTFGTPVGELPGVVIHAARWSTFKFPVHEPWPVWGFGLDLFTAFLFSFVVQYFWMRYVKSALADNPSTRERKNYWAAGFVFAYGLIIIIGFLAAEYLFANLGLIIAPLVMAASMLVDGFMTGPINAFIEFDHMKHSPKNEGGSASKLDALAKISHLIRFLVFWLVVLWAFYLLIH